MIVRVIGDFVSAGGSASGDDMRDRVCVGVDDSDRAVAEPDPKLMRPGYREDSVSRAGQRNGSKEDAVFRVDHVDLRPDYRGRRGIPAIGKVVPCVRGIDPTYIVSRETASLTSRAAGERRISQVLGILRALCCVAVNQKA